MIILTKDEILKKMNFFRGLTDEEIAKIADLCSEEKFDSGQLCQKEGSPVTRVNFIVKGKVGVEFHIPSIAHGNKDIIFYALNEGDVFGWSSLIKGIPWSTLRAIEPVTVLSINSNDLLNLCETNTHIGYYLMRSLSSLIASRLRRSRTSTLNAIVAIKGEW